MSTIRYASMASTKSFGTIAKIAAFGTLAAMLVMLAFVSIPAASASLIKNVLIKIHFDDVVDIDKVKVSVLSGNKVIFYDVVDVNNNDIAVNAPIDVSLLEVGNVQVCANVISVAGDDVENECKQITKTTDTVRFNF